MKEHEHLVVHVKDAIRFAAMIDEPHLRLGVVLLDSAAELMMYRVTYSPSPIRPRVPVHLLTRHDVAMAGFAGLFRIIRVGGWMRSSARCRASVQTRLSSFVE